MSSIIYFTSGSSDIPLTVRVAEDVEDLFSKLTAAAGLPIPLTGVKRAEGQRVYVNPASIAYWREAPSRGMALS